MADGRQTYEGDAFPATFVEDDDPLWSILADRWRSTLGKGKMPSAIRSKYAAGSGTWFRTDWVDDELGRDDSLRLYRRPQEYPAAKERVTKGFDELKAWLAADSKEQGENERRAAARRAMFDQANVYYGKPDLDLPPVKSFAEMCKERGIDPAT